MKTRVVQYVYCIIIYQAIALLSKLTKIFLVVLFSHILVKKGGVFYDHIRFMISSNKMSHSFVMFLVQRSSAAV